MDLLNDVLSAVSVGLDAHFPGVEIFPELVPNELPKRCFLLGFVGDVPNDRVSKNLYELSGTLDIAYLSPKRGASLQRELNRVFMEISLHLQLVAFGEISVRLMQHKRRVVDDILHDICNFSTQLYQVEHTPQIREIKVGGMLHP